MICPECHENIDERGAVAVEVSLSAGDELGGSSSAARVALCGACGKNLLTKYTTLAIDAHNARAREPTR
jgi:hypothetical protein